MRVLIKEYLKESLNNKELSEDFIELIKHNFLAKFVYYNPLKDAIEIGVEDPDSGIDSYPEIKIFSYPIEGKNIWLNESLKKDKNDMAFYGRLLNRKKLLFKNAEVIVI